MAVKVTTNLEPLDRAFAGMVDDFAAECQDTFDNPIWAWPATTRRRNGELAGTRRDLVDLGDLKASQQPPEFTGNSARITWDADHAATAFLGAVFRKRAYSMPARNLPTVVARSFDWQASFAKHFK